MPITFTDQFDGIALSADWVPGDPGFYGDPVISGGLLKVSTAGALIADTAATFGGDFSIDMLIEFTSSVPSSNVKVGLSDGISSIIAFYGSGLVEVVAGANFTDDTGVGGLTGRYVLRLVATVASGVAIATIFPEGSPGSPVGSASAVLDAGALAAMASGTAVITINANDNVPQTLAIDSIGATAETSTYVPPTPPVVVDTDAAFEVRITPLFKPTVGATAAEVANDTNIVAINEADTILVTQYADLTVEHNHNEGRSGHATISMHDAILDTPPFAIEEYACALWIGFRRPGALIAEGILYGQCNVIDNYDDTATVVLEAQDPYLGKATHHYVRRGDTVLNVDGERGRINADVFGISAILDAARNTDQQMQREMPAFALGETFDPATTVGPPFDLERGQEVAGLCSEIVKQGPDIDIVPSWGWPTKAYATMYMFKSPGDPASPTAGQLGRNLDPADPDAPAAGDVIFERGIGQSNLVSCNRTPDLPSTHVHVLDESRKYRVTGVDETSSSKVGAFVNWIATQLTVPRPHVHFSFLGVRTQVPADTSALQALADAHIKAYGKPPAFVTMTLMPPDTPGMYQYGHPDWAAAMDDIGGDWYMGDYVRVRATEGFRSFSELMRVKKVTFSTQGWNGLPEVAAEVEPAIGGSLAPGSTDGV